MNKPNGKKTELGNAKSSASPKTKKALLNSSLRKYAKPIIFKDNIPEDKVFKNLSASFKLKPSLKISNFNITITASAKNPMKIKPRNYVNTESAETPPFVYVQVARNNTPTKYRASRKEKLKPMFKQHSVDSKIIGIEGRPCSRSNRYSYIEPRNFTATHSKTQSEEINAIHISVKRHN